MKFNKHFLISIILCFGLSTPLKGANLPGYPHHHIHNFYAGPEVAKHAVAMGYYLVPTKKPNDPKYNSLGLIKIFNAKVIPIRIFEKRETGEIFVQYRWLEKKNSNSNPLAAIHGLERKNRVFYPISKEDIDIIIKYAAARKKSKNIDLGDLSLKTFREYFFPAWQTMSKEWVSLNLIGNWQSKWVVDNMVAATIADFPWEKYRAVFFDSFGLELVEQTVNSDIDNKGEYRSWVEGNLDMVIRISNAFRDTLKTKQKEPYAVFANIYDPKRNLAYRTVAKWYAENTLRLDHYYFEKGGFGSQAPNGVVPGTDFPAYVDPKNPSAAYIPANRMSLDDVTNFNRSDFDKKDNYDREEHFEQHLDACGTAGLNGAWFGWYGADLLNLKHKGEMIYTNDLQLLRAIPNWDNIASVTVPSFKKYTPQDQRKWNGNKYESSNSFAESDVIWSRNPFNKQIYVVFKNTKGELKLRQNEAIATAIFVDKYFEETNEDALPFLNINYNYISLKSESREKLNKGIRISTKKVSSDYKALNPILIKHKK